MSCRPKQDKKPRKPRPPCKPRPSCPSVPDFEEAKDVQELVAYYRKAFADSFHRLEKLENVTDYVCGCHNELPVTKYCRNSHTYCIPTRVMAEMIRRLSDIDRQEFKDFEELCQYVDSKRIPGYGNLCIYDFSLAYGYNHNLKPEKRVYLHAGALVGGKQLRLLGYIDRDVAQPSMPIEAFDPLLRGLGSMHLENFMCVAHKQLKKLADAKKKTTNH